MYEVLFHINSTGYTVIFHCQRTVKILFSAEVANIVYDLGWIMQVVKQQLLN